jgi:DNA-binding transcriptional LysR family regulator
MKHHRFLRYVDEVARTGSVRKAAERLNVTASALNRRLLDIEEELGHLLFERHARGMRLTAAGEAFIRYVRQQSSSLARLRSELEDMSGFRRGEVKLAVSQAVAYELIPREIASYRREFPLVEFRVRVCDRGEALGALLDYSADLILAFSPERLSELEPLASAPQPVHAIMSSKHPLARKSQLRLRDVVQYPLALPERGLGSRMLLDTFFARSSLSFRLAVETNSFEILKRFVKLEKAVGFQIQIGTPQGIVEDGIVARPIVEPGLPLANLVLGQLRGRILPIAAFKFGQQMAKRLEAIRA